MKFKYLIPTSNLTLQPINNENRTYLTEYQKQASHLIVPYTSSGQEHLYSPEILVQIIRAFPDGKMVNIRTNRPLSELILIHSLAAAFGNYLEEKFHLTWQLVKDPAIKGALNDILALSVPNGAFVVYPYAVMTAALKDDSSSVFEAINEIKHTV